MAIAEMSRLKLIGLKSERNRIMNVLTRSHLVEVFPSDNIDGIIRIKDTSHLNNILAKQARIAFSIDFLSKLKAECLAANEKGEAEIEIPQGKEVQYAKIGYDDFYDTAAREYELLTVSEALDKISFNKIEIKTQINKSRTYVKNLTPYENLPMKFSEIQDTKNTFLIVAVGAINKSDSFKQFGIYECFPSSLGELVCITGLIEDKEKTLSKFSELGFTICPYRFDSFPKDIIKTTNEEIVKLNEKYNVQLVNSVTYYKYLESMKVLYDVLGSEIEKAQAELDFVSTMDTFIIEGWTPTDSAQKLIDEVKLKTEKIVAFITPAGEEDNPPTLIKSSKIFKPYEDVTNLYSPPAYREIDPNPFMAVFFFVFFGMMIGDAGYGIILSIACGLILKFMKPDKGMKGLLMLVGMGGLSAIIWGVLFGGVFSIDGIPALWFNPIQEPLLMLIVSIILGVVQLLFGYALMAANLIKKGKVLDAILDAGVMFLLFFSVGFMAVSMVIPSMQILMTLGLIGLIASLGIILLTGGRHSKGVLSKIMGGFAGLYGLVNVLSDVLSYARLFGLGLASAAIGMAFNTLCGLLFAIPVVGYVIGFIILIPLHAFNLGIGVLGAYVHNSRLQYLEFYGKFYEGNGSLFNPLGEKTKYVRFI